MRSLLTVMAASLLATATVQAEEPGCARDKSHEKHRTAVEWFQGRPVLTWIRGHEYHCLSSINSLGCGSLKSECTFMFGSCRDFYGEPCFKDPQPFRKHQVGLNICAFFGPCLSQSVCRLPRRGCKIQSRANKCRASPRRFDQRM